MIKFEYFYDKIAMNSYKMLAVPLENESKVNMFITRHQNTQLLYKQIAS